MHENEERSALIVVTSEVQSPQVPAWDGTANRESNQLIAANTDTELIAAYLGRGGLSAKSVKNTGKEPAALLGKMKTPHESRVSRYLSKEAIDLVFATVQAIEAKTPSARMRKARDQFLVVAYYMTGARLAELVAADMGAVYQEDGRWWLDVIGKGAKPRRLPVSQKLLAAFEEYRVAYGLLPRTVRDDKTPLVLTSRGGLLRATEGAVSNAVTGVFEAAARLADSQGDEEKGASLRKASTHWLRHYLPFLTMSSEMDGLELPSFENDGTVAQISHSITRHSFLHPIACSGSRGAGLPAGGARACRSPEKSSQGPALSS